MIQVAKLISTFSVKKLIKTKKSETQVLSIATLWLNRDLKMAEVPQSLIQMVPQLGHANVRMKDPAKVEAAIKSMMNDAPSKLQVIADFDFTLSKYIENGQLCNTTHGVLEQSELMTEAYKKKATKMTEYYLPIEFDPNLTVEQKIPKMIEWWKSGHALLESSQLTKEKLSLIVAKSRARLRNGCVALFDHLNKLGVPLLLFSAGLGDIILETVKQQATLHPNIKLVSNFMNFDADGNMAGFTSNDCIHTFNKNEHSLHNSDYFDLIKHRCNVILMGDHIGDLKMATGVQNIESLLKIGFLNFKVEQNLGTYLDNFDVVIIEDESVDVVNGIVQAVDSHQSASLVHR